MCGGSLPTLYLSNAVKIKIANLKASIRRYNDSISEDVLTCVNVLYISEIDARNVWMKEDNISYILCYKVSDYFSL